MAPISSPRLLPVAVLGACCGVLVPGCFGAPPDAPASSLGPLPPGVAPGADGSAARGATPLVLVEASELAVTSGEITPDGPGRFSIASPTLRAELGRSPRAGAELAFEYRGPTHDLAPLASGEARRQIGLKLRAHDTCNVVYVMWHIEPSPGIVVSVKSNPGQSRHAECGDRGYVFLEPVASQPAPRIEQGQSHVLGAMIRGRELLVTTDGLESWRGQLPAAALEFDGPVGLRSDNGEFAVQLRAEEVVQ